MHRTRRTTHARLWLTIIVFLMAIGLLPHGTMAQSPPSAQQPPATTASPLSLKEDLVVANRVLFDRGFVDTAGHVSVRLGPSRFLMAWRRAPELVVVDDILEFDLDANTAEAKGRPVALERFIHSEIYRGRPDVQAVVHSHTPSLVMFSSSNIPLRPLFAGAAFIGEGVPAFKNGDAGGGINNGDLGRKLLETMGKGGAVLMRGHGVVVAAPSLVALVQRALNLDTNAQLVSRLLAMGDKEPIYIRPAPEGGGEAANTRVGAGGDNSREWEAYKRRAEALMKGAAR
jgi:HCOMODA/2-hydroxy-3-carboxy-muconic semialdehyde decarboxylase